MANRKNKEYNEAVAKVDEIAVKAMQLCRGMANENCYDIEWVFDMFKRRLVQLEDEFEDGIMSVKAVACEPSFSCERITCKHHCDGNRCDIKPVFGYRDCKSFEKGFWYYISIVWEAMGKSNFIDCVHFGVYGDDLRNGIFYVMKIWGLIFNVREWGLCRFISLHKDEGEKALNSDEIVELPINTDELQHLIEEFNKGILPSSKVEKIKTEKEQQPFGWLSPDGTFLEGDFGDHEAIAYKIVQNKKFDREYAEWRNIDENRGKMARDFLCEVKGYCLIHNPSGFGGYIVTHTKTLTKKQNDFLFMYFMEIGDIFKAEQYVNDN